MAGYWADTEQNNFFAHLEAKNTAKKWLKREKRHENNVMFNYRSSIQNLRWLYKSFLFTFDILSNASTRGFILTNFWFSSDIYLILNQTICFVTLHNAFCSVSQQFVKHLVQIAEYRSTCCEKISFYLFLLETLQLSVIFSSFYKYYHYPVRIKWKHYSAIWTTNRIITLWIDLRFDGSRTGCLPE